MASSLKRLVVGRPLATSAETTQRLTKLVALAVFSSDAISSSAYATEEILDVLIPQTGLREAIDTLIPISIVVVVLLALVVFSYHQTIRAYPSGGGSYVVSRENLGTNPSLVAGGALMVDYTLTVAVSVSAGVAAVTSAYPHLTRHRVWLCLGVVAVLTVGNLRGLRTAGRWFALPTYLYILSLGALIVVGLVRSFTGDLDALPTNEARVRDFTGTMMLAGLTPLLLMRAFSSGAVALTGIEAISNGVPAFRKPEPRNAAITLTWMATILGSAFFLLAVLVHRLNPTPFDPSSPRYQTLLSILGEHVFGGKNGAYLVLQASTALILALAANTAFADFPRLSSFIARDGFLPRQFTARGDRLVFSNGIFALAAAAGVLLVVFRGATNALIPLYAVGVFTAFTLSQAGMVRHHRRLRERGWRGGLLVNAIGAVATLLVLIDVVVSKFLIGAWIPVVVIPLLVLGFHAIRRHYRRVEGSVRVPAGWKAPAVHHQAVVVVIVVNRGVLEAVAYARALTPDRLVAVAVPLDADQRADLEREWREADPGLPLTVLDSPYRHLTEPVLAYLDRLDAAHDGAVTTVVLPEFATDHAWEAGLHNQVLLLLAGELRRRPRTGVVTYSYRATD
jgi:amino acid transporter